MAYYVSRKGYDAQKDDLYGIEVVIINANFIPVNEPKSNKTKEPTANAKKFFRNRKAWSQ